MYIGTESIRSVYRAAVPMYKHVLNYMNQLRRTQISIRELVGFSDRYENVPMRCSLTSPRSSNVSVCKTTTDDDDNVRLGHGVANVITILV